MFSASPAPLASAADPREPERFCRQCGRALAPKQKKYCSHSCSGKAMAARKFLSMARDNRAAGFVVDPLSKLDFDDSTELLLEARAASGVRR